MFCVSPDHSPVRSRKIDVFCREGILPTCQGATQQSNRDQNLGSRSRAGRVNHGVSPLHQSSMAGTLGPRRAHREGH